jgi:hypothetical protein
MAKPRLFGIVGVTTAVGIMLIVASVGGCGGNSASRIEREHGLVLPPSASQFVCRGDAWKHTFIDAGAASAFEIASNDLPKFLAQLKIKDTHKGAFGQDYTNSIYPGNPQYQIHRPWMTGTPLETYQCTSPKGDFLSIQIWPIDGSHVGVCLYTDWN